MHHRRFVKCGGLCFSTSMEKIPSLSNEAILEQLKCGAADFELTSSPLPSVCSHGRAFSSIFSGGTRHSFFARIGPSLTGGSPALKKVERYSIQKVTGDGRCLFRALVKGMAVNKGISLNRHKERDDADELRMAVKEVICDNDSERRQYKEAIIAITVDQPLKRYCQQIGRSDFWGGEPELLVLSKLCSQPIIVYIPEREHGGQGYGFIPIAEYGEEFRKSPRGGNPRKVDDDANNRKQYEGIVNMSQPIEKKIEQRIEKLERETENLTNDLRHSNQDLRHDNKKLVEDSETKACS